MRIYVSSTFDDLRECRQGVHDMLRRMRQDDVAMEHYVAEPERPPDVCRRDVRECDLFVGIYAWRYGFVPDGEGASITELEYREAVAAGKPCLVFVLHEDAPWPRSSMERGPGAERIDALRAEVMAAHTVELFSSADELPGLVAAAVNRRLVESGGATPGPEPERYRARVRERYGRLDLETLTPPEREEYLQIQLESVFVEQHVREDPPPVELPRDLVQRLLAEGGIAEDELPDGVDAEDVRLAWETYRTKPRRPVLDVLAGGDRCCVVLGDPGAGKSTLARYLALTPAGSRLPLLVELRRYVAARDRNVCTTLLGFLGHLGESQDLGPGGAELECYLRDGGPALVVFDGLDEIFDKGLREETAHEIAAFAGRFPDVRVVVTSRVLGYRRAALTDAGFAHFTLQDLDRDQIAEFLDNWYGLALHDRPEQAGQSRSRLLAAVDDSRSIAELAGNPLLLTILAIIGKNQTLPRERWRVYDHAARVLVQQWDVNRRLAERGVVTEHLDEEDKRELLRRLALRMQTGATADGGGNLIHRDELHEVFETYLAGRLERGPAVARAAASAMIEQFRERNFVLSRFGPELYGFVHRAFLEFFCADAVVQDFQRHRSLSPDDLVALFVDRCADPSWREVLRLLASRLSEAHVGPVLDALLARDRPWPEFGGEPMAPGLMLAVQCLAEVRAIREIPEQAGRVLETVGLALEYQVIAPLMVEPDLIPAARSIGPSWPGRQAYLDWFLARGRHLVWAPVTEYAAVLVAILFPDRVDALLSLRGLAGVGDHRTDAALRAAALELRDVTIPPGTSGDLAAVERLVAAESAEARTLGVVLLDRTTPDDPMVDERLRRALRDETDDEVFGMIAEILLRRLPDGSEVLGWAVDRALAHRDAAGAYRHGGLHGFLNRHCPEHEIARYGRFVGELAELDGYDEQAVSELVARIGPEPGARIWAAAALADVGSHVRLNAVLVLDHVAPEATEVDERLAVLAAAETVPGVFHTAVGVLRRRRPSDSGVLDAALRRCREQPFLAWSDEQPPDDPRLAEIALLAELRTRGPLDAEDAEWAAGRCRHLGIGPDELWRRLADGDYAARHNAVLVVDRMAPLDPEVTGWIRTVLRDDPDDDVVEAAARTLLARCPDDVSVLDLVYERTWHTTTVALASVGYVLLRQYRPDDPRTGLIEILRSDHPLFWQAVTVDDADRPPAPDSGAAFVRFLQERREPVVRHQAVRVLRDASGAADAEITACLELLARDDDAGVRHAAAAALSVRGTAGNGTATPVAGPHRRPSAFGFRTEELWREGLLTRDGVDALARSIPGLRGELPDAVLSDDPAERRNAVLVWDRTAGPDAPELRTLLLALVRHDPQEDVVHAAVSVLLRRTPDDPEVLAALRRRCDERIAAVELDEPGLALLDVLATGSVPVEAIPYEPVSWRDRIRHGLVRLNELPPVPDPAGGAR